MAERSVKFRSAALSLMAVVSVMVPAPVLAYDLLFLGVTDVRGESVQPELESVLRAEFAADRRYRLIGGVETERAVREMERQGRTRAEAVIPRSAGFDDSTVVVRAVVTEVSVVTKRSPWLLWGMVDARMRMEVVFSDLSGRPSYRGEFGAEASMRKEVILFQDPKKAVHVSAVEREELLGRMRGKLMKDAVGLVAVYFNAFSSGGASSKASAGVADTAAAPGSGAEFSTVDGAGVAPIGGGGAADSGQ